MRRDSGHFGEPGAGVGLKFIDRDHRTRLNGHDPSFDPEIAKNAFESQPDSMLNLRRPEASKWSFQQNDEFPSASGCTEWPDK